MRTLRACLALAFLPALTLGCPKKSAPDQAAAPAVTEGAAAATDGDADAPSAYDFADASAAKAEVVLKVDWINRNRDAPDMKYTTPGLPAVSADGQLIVVPHEEETGAYPNLSLLTLRAWDEQPQGNTVIQTVQEYNETLYPPYVDWPTPGITDPKFRDLLKVVDRRIASTNAQLASWRPLPKCRVEKDEDEAEDAGADDAATPVLGGGLGGGSRFGGFAAPPPMGPDGGVARHRQVIHCPGLEIIHDRHRLRVVGRGGRVRFERKTNWRKPGAAPGYGYGAVPASVVVVDTLDGIYGDAAPGVIVFHVKYDVSPRYYGRMMQPEWHVVKLN